MISVVRRRPPERVQHERPHTREPSGQTVGPVPPPQSISQSAGLVHWTRHWPPVQLTSHGPSHRTSQSGTPPQLTWLFGPTWAVHFCFTHSHETLQRWPQVASQVAAPVQMAVQSSTHATEQA